MTLAERLRCQLDETEGTGVPYPSDARGPVEGVGTPAAVLIAITDRSEPGLILTQRTDTMRRHAGQVAFPGGRVDPEDDDEIDAALREADEEIGLNRGDVTIVGPVDRYRTVTGYDILPVVAVIPPGLVLTPHDVEVAAVFEVPLAFALDAANRNEREVMFEGRQRRYFEIMWGERRIWGATAAMLVNLGHRLQW